MGEFVHPTVTRNDLWKWIIQDNNEAFCSLYYSDMNIIPD